MRTRSGGPAARRRFEATRTDAGCLVSHLRWAKHPHFASSEWILCETPAWKTCVQLPKSLMLKIQFKVSLGGLPSLQEQYFLSLPLWLQGIPAAQMWRPKRWQSLSNRGPVAPNYCAVTSDSNSCISKAREIIWDVRKKKNPRSVARSHGWAKWKTATRGRPALIFFGGGVRVKWLQKIIWTFRRRNMNDKWLLCNEVYGCRSIVFPQ